MTRKTVMLPVRCSVVKRWHSKLPEIMLMLSAVLSVLSFASPIYLILTGMRVNYNWYGVAMATVSFIGMLWGIVLLAVTFSMYYDTMVDILYSIIAKIPSSEAMGDALDRGAAWLVYGTEHAITSLLEKFPRLECIPDEETP
jgi:hypothetical protein